MLDRADQYGEPLDIVATLGGRTVESLTPSEADSLCVALNELGRSEEATSICHVIHARMRSQDSLSRLAWQYVMSGNPASAFDLVAQMSRDADQPDMELLVGVIHAVSGDSTLAASKLRQLEGWGQEDGANLLRLYMIATGDAPANDLSVLDRIAESPLTSGATIKAGLAVAMAKREWQRLNALLDRVPEHWNTPVVAIARVWDCLRSTGVHEAREVAKEVLELYPDLKGPNALQLGIFLLEHVGARTAIPVLEAAANTLQDPSAAMEYLSWANLRCLKIKAANTLARRALRVRPYSVLAGRVFVSSSLMRLQLRDALAHLRLLGKDKLGASPPQTPQ